MYLQAPSREPQQAGHVWLPAGSRSIWCPTSQRWFSVTVESRFSHDLACWEACINGAVLLRAKPQESEADAIAAAEAWLIHYFPNP